MVRATDRARWQTARASMSKVAGGLALAAGLAGCAADGGDVPGSRVAIAVAPLSLPDVTDACFTLSVNAGDPTQGADLVWTLAGICADRYGDGVGSIAYVGTCDASVPGPNVVSLVLEDLFAGAPPAAIDPTTYVNPCPASAPCMISAPCTENADTPVTFDLTVLRAANQGFFDVAVNFADVFCSAKLDCTDGDGPLMLLHDPATGERAETAVLGFACTAGMGETTWMHLDDVVIRCDDATTTVDGLPGACSGGRTFSDDTFDHAGTAWTGSSFASGLQPEQSSGGMAVLPSGGNTGGATDPKLQLSVHHHGGSNVHTWAFYPLGTWNPATDGPITKLSGHYDVRLASIDGTNLSTGEHFPPDPGQGGNVQLALRQGGAVFAPSLGFLCGPGVDCYAWRTKSGLWDIAGLGPGQIDNAINVPNSHINVTNGGPIEFGVLIGLTGGASGYDFDYVYEVDNWSVTVETACTEPTPGNAGPALPGTYDTAVYFGREAFPGLDKCYWNLALGLDLDGGLGANCVLETRGTASPEAFPGGLTPAGVTWPIIHWQVQVTDADGALACGAHAVNVPGSGVATEYTGATPVAFDHSRACSPETSR